MGNVIVRIERSATRMVAQAFKKRCKINDFPLNHQIFS